MSQEYSESLTDKACKAIESLYSKQASIRESIFFGLSDKELRDINEKKPAKAETIPR